MTDRDEYREDLDLLVGRIRDIDPPDLGTRFASHCAFGPSPHHQASGLLVPARAAALRVLRLADALRARLQTRTPRPG